MQNPDLGGRIFFLKTAYFYLFFLFFFQPGDVPPLKVFKLSLPQKSSIFFDWNISLG